MDALKKMGGKSKWGSDGGDCVLCVGGKILPI